MSLDLSLVAGLPRRWRWIVLLALLSATALLIVGLEPAAMEGVGSWRWCPAALSPA